MAQRSYYDILGIDEFLKDPVLVFGFHECFYGKKRKAKELIRQFTRREVVQKYKGSYLGLVWSFLTPLAMLAVYTFAFSVILGARWESSGRAGGHMEFALTLFAGLIVFNVFRIKSIKTIY